MLVNFIKRYCLSKFVSNNVNHIILIFLSFSVIFPCSKIIVLFIKPKNDYFCYNLPNVNYSVKIWTSSVFYLDSDSAFLRVLTSWVLGPRRYSYYTYVNYKSSSVFVMRCTQTLVYLWIGYTSPGCLMFGANLLKKLIVGTNN